MPLSAVAYLKPSQRLDSWRPCPGVEPVVDKLALMDRANGGGSDHVRMLRSHGSASPMEASGATMVPIAPPN